MQYLKPDSIIFISSPYSVGSANRNVRAQHDAFQALHLLGYKPLTPLVTHYHDIIYPMDYTEILMWCLAMVPLSHAILRLPGESTGSDMIAEEALKHGIPVIADFKGAMAAFMLPDQQTLTPDLGPRYQAMSGLRRMLKPKVTLSSSRRRKKRKPSPEA